MVRIALVRFRWEIVSLKQTSKGKRLTVPTSSNWLSIRKAMMGPVRRLHFAWIGEVRLKSNRRLLITWYQILENAFQLRFNAYSLRSLNLNDKFITEFAKHHLNEFTSEDDSLAIYIV